MKKYILFFLLSIVYGVGIIIGIRWWTIRYVNSVSGWLAKKAEVSYSAATFPQDDYVEVRGDSVTVLFLGNSITYHPRLDDIGWYSQWGMAASKPEKDYVHILQQFLLKRKELKYVKVLPMNIIRWERDFCVDKDSLIGNQLKEADIVIIRLGENVPEAHVPDFLKAMLDLLAYCEKQTHKILVTGVFWQNPQKDAALMEAARRTNHPFVPLSWIHELYDVCPMRGDTLYDELLDPYVISSNFITDHPNDQGMYMVAKEIERKLR